MGDKKVYKIGLLPMLLLILDIILIIVVIIMGITIKSLRDEKNKIENEKNAAKEVVDTTPVLTNVVENTVSNEISSKEENEVDNTSSDNSTSEETSDVKYISKVVENKSYIYDAQYSPNDLKITNYSTNDGTDYTVYDIVLPYINMVSEDARNTNSEIEELYSKYTEEFRICSQNKNSFIKVNYKTYITSNIYSILITVQRGNEINSTEEYISYNFDIITGTKLDYSNICYVASITDASQSVLDCIDTLEDFDSYYLTVNSHNSQEEVDERNAQITACKNQIYTYYQQDLLNNSLVYFLDSNLKLNIVLKVILPDNTEGYAKIVVV